jgi:hypothetical protein
MTTVRSLSSSRFLASIILCAFVAFGCTDDGGITSGVECEGVPHTCEVGGTTQCNTEGDTVETCTFDASSCLVWRGVGCGERQGCKVVDGVATCTCTDNCTLGEQRCDANAVEMCAETSDGCLDWEIEQECDDSHYCDENSYTCVNECQDECIIEGDLQCDWSNLFIQTCTLDIQDGCLYWEESIDCSAESQVCMDTGAPECITPCTNDCLTEGSVQCDASALIIQNCTLDIQDGCFHWDDTSTCDIGCLTIDATISCDGGCFTIDATATCMECVTGDTQCGGTDLETCDASQIGWDLTTCTHGCDDSLDTAVCRLCTPGSTICNAYNDLDVCATDGLSFGGFDFCAWNQCGDVGGSGVCLLHTAAAELEPNDDPADADHLDLPGEKRGTIDPGDDYDYFEFVVTETTTIALHTNSYNGDTVDTRLWLYDSWVDSGMLDTTICDGSDGCLAFDDDNGPGLYTSIAPIELPPGTYYIIVDSYVTEIGDYALRLYIPECLGSETQCDVDTLHVCNQLYLWDSTSCVNGCDDSGPTAKCIP